MFFNARTGLRVQRTAASQRSGALGRFRAARPTSASSRDSLPPSSAADVVQVKSPHSVSRAAGRWRHSGEGKCKGKKAQKSGNFKKSSRKWTRMTLHDAGRKGLLVNLRGKNTETDNHSYKDGADGKHQSSEFHNSSFRLWKKNTLTVAADIMHHRQCIVMSMNTLLVFFRT